MAKVKLTRRTFADAIAQNMEKANGLESIFTKALVGKTLEDFLSEQPDRQVLWVDTDKVVCATDLTKESTTGEVVFGLMFMYQPKISDIVWFDSCDYDAFMKVWKGE